MTLRERIARWLAPSAFAAAEAPHPVAAVAETLRALPPDELPAALPNPIQAPLEPEPTLPPEYDAAVTLYWGDNPFVAAKTRAHVRTLLRLKGPRLSTDDVIAACRGNVLTIE